MVSIVSEARNKIYKMDRSWHQYAQVRSSFSCFHVFRFFFVVFSFYKMDRSWHQYVQVRSRTIEVASAGTIGGGGTIGRPELHFDSLPATNIQIYTQSKMFAEHDQKYKQRIISIC